VKRIPILLAAFLFMFIVAATLGIAQATANAQLALETTTTPSATDTPSATPTETSTSTPTPTFTLTPTTDPCPPPPEAPHLRAPDNKKTVNTVQLTLRWTSVPCATKYRILVRRGSEQGDPVQRGSTKKTKVTTVSLQRGFTYYWNIKSCIINRCTRSKTWTFTIAAPPTPTRRPTNPPSHGTPVPGDPPGNLRNYQGSSVYLYTDPSQLWYFDCGFKWRPMGQGSLYTISLWFYPNERVRYDILNFNLAQVVGNGEGIANGAGYLDLTFDTSSWTPDHYHLIFYGQSSDVVYCGHFDLVGADRTSIDLPPDSHSPSELKRIYDAAGITIPGINDEHKSAP
jgi:hypothetical protein